MKRTSQVLDDLEARVEALEEDMDTRDDTLIDLKRLIKRIDTLEKQVKSLQAKRTWRA